MAPRTGTSRIVPVHLIGEECRGITARTTYGSAATSATLRTSRKATPTHTAPPARILPGSTVRETTCCPLLWAFRVRFKQNYEYAMAAVLGLEAQGNADYNYQVNGTVLPVGAPVTPRIRKQRNRDVRAGYLEGHARIHHYRGHSPWPGAAGTRSQWTTGLDESFRSRHGWARARTMPSKVCRSRTRV